MNANNQEYILLHADAEWMKDILKRIEEILDKDSISLDDIKAARWLIKQALKVERED
jgi:hypothetical protein